MKKLLVICGAGMTSSVLVSAMRESASGHEEEEYRIGSCAISQMEKYVPQADIVFLAPHLSYMKDDLRRKYPDRPVFLIPAEFYSNVDGAGVLALMNKKQDEKQENRSRFTWAVSALAGRKILRAMTEASSQLIAVLVTGGIFVLIRNFPYQPYLDLIRGTWFETILKAGEGMTINCISVYLAFLIGYHYGNKYDLSPGHTGLNSLISFFLLLNIQGNMADMTYFGTKGMFCAMITAFFSVRLYLMSKNLSRRFFHQLRSVPQSVYESFLDLIPMLWSVIVFTAIAGVFMYSHYETFPAFIYENLQRSVSSWMGSSLPSIMLSMLATTTLWYFGIHGGQVTGAITRPILLPLSLENIAARQAGLPLPHIIHSQFTIVCTFGGAGATLGLAILMAFFAKSERMKQLGKLSLPMGIFFINEPIILGLPLMLNPLMLVPLICVPQVSIVLTYFVMSIGLVPPAVGYELPFTTPPLISGLMQGGWRLALWQLVLIFVQIALWYPFFRIQDGKYLEEETVRKSAAPDGNPQKGNP